MQQASLIFDLEQEREDFLFALNAEAYRETFDRVYSLIDEVARERAFKGAPAKELAERLQHIIDVRMDPIEVMTRHHQCQ